jgi:ubiquinone/menaquinone biosynthesis C-methylase UbiE
MKSWLNEQNLIAVSRFDQTMDDLYPESMEYSKNAKSFMDHIMKETNYIEAIEMLDWDLYLPERASLLDLACGIGWVSAYLSKLDCVDHITCVDSSKYYVNDMLPNIFRQMDGKLDKVTPVEGVFCPLLLDDDSIDGVILCASIHHADNMETVLKEVYRVLKPGGRLFILNESPYSTLQYLFLSIKCMIKVLLHIILKKYQSISLSIAYSCILVDPYLGDRVYPLWVMNDMLKESGFSNAVKIESGFLHMKSGKHRGTILTHFVCEKD